MFAKEIASELCGTYYYGDDEYYISFTDGALINFGNNDSVDTMYVLTEVENGYSSFCVISITFAIIQNSFSKISE